MLLPLPSKEWTIEKAAHLLNRAGFGGSPIEVEALFKKGLEEARKSMKKEFVSHDEIMRKYG